MKPTFDRKTACNTGFASGGLTCKVGAMCIYSSSALVDSFVLRNPPERKARKRCTQYIFRTGEFKNLTQQMINFIFVELWKKNTNDYRLKNEL